MSGPQGGNGGFCHVLDPKEPTCKGNTLDYLAVNHRARHTVLTWSVDQENAQATHAAARVSLQGSLQPGLVGLWAPKSLPDRLSGCLREGWEANLLDYPSQHLATQDLDQAVRSWARAAEAHLLALADVPVRRWQDYHGRGGAPRTLARASHRRTHNGGRLTGEARTLAVLRGQLQQLAAAHKANCCSQGPTAAHKGHPLLTRASCCSQWPAAAHNGEQIRRIP